LSRKDHQHRDELIESLSCRSRELSTATVLFHHWISERLGLNTIDHKCLDIIIRAEIPITGVQLAKLTGLSTGAVTGVVDRLEKRGFVTRERDIKDRRLVFIRPVTQKIEKEIVPFFNSLHDTFAKFYSRFTDEELKLILDFSTQCVNIMKSHTAKMMNARA
jgi:DNA-binding MarR family transcriptional regulator